MRSLFIFTILLFSHLASADFSLPTPYRGSRLLSPRNPRPSTSILLLHGSEGGSAHSLDDQAEILSHAGYTVLLYCYFDCNRTPGLPQNTLENVELRDVASAIAWLRSRPQSNGKVVVYGFSRGAELTMILGSLLPQAAGGADALIAHSPSDVYQGPWNWIWSEPRCWLCPRTEGCDPKKTEQFEWVPTCGANPRQLNPKPSAWRLNGVSIPQGQRIEIERYRGPIFISVGLQDEIWPVSQSQNIEVVLKKRLRPVEIHYFPGEKHNFSGSAEARRRQMVMQFLKNLNL